MRETVKQVKHEVDGVEQTFQIHKMDALRGSYLMKFCTEKFLPLLNDIQSIVTNEKPKDEKDVDRIALAGTEQIISMIPKVLASMSEEELITFEIRCLRTVDMMKPAGWQPVMVGDNWGVEELENDLKTVLLLCYEVVEFNLGSFFGGKSLSSFLPGKNS